MYIEFRTFLVHFFKGRFKTDYVFTSSLISFIFVIFLWISRLIMCLCFKYGKNEPLLIKEIVTDILNKLLSTSISDTENLVGIDARMQEIEMRLCLGPV